MKTVYPPTRIGHPSVFLAGTIDNGNSRDWQTELVTELNQYLDTIHVFEDFVFANPRRPDWNTDWSSDKTELVKQITWELNAMHGSDVIFMWFEPNSKSPVTMLELGLHLGTGDKLVVGCPREFYRYQNVVTTSRWARDTFHTNHVLTHDWNSFVKACKDRLRFQYSDES